MEFSLPIPNDARARLARGWLHLGLASLLGSGLFSVLLVLQRAPYTQKLFPRTDFFHTALVAHVDLSVLVWFLAFAGVLWSLNSTARGIGAGRFGLGIAAAGTLAMALAPFAGEPRPLLSNYIPVLQQPLFLAGLVAFALGVVFLVLRALTAVPPVGARPEGAGALRFGLNAAAVATTLAGAAFAWSYFTLPGTLAGKAYYELLFWGGSHVLQFTYTLLMLVAWLWLASASGLRLTVSPRVALLLFALGLTPVFFVPVIYYSHSVATAEHIRFFTWHMQYGGGLAALPLGLAVLSGYVRARHAPEAGRPLRAALLVSVALFGIGGVIGFLIQGSNVTIPAHYHGSIVGVTLAFMGLTYHLLPWLGYRAVDWKWASLQPYLYGGGQLLHVLGLLWSGGYGVQRKVAGAAQGLESTEKIAAMGLMGLGGLVAILGGLLFLVLVYRAMRPSKGRRD
jgi:hypothetical protein